RRHTRSKRDWSSDVCSSDLPKILLADEPVAALDPASSGAVISLLEQICREDNLTVISSLHQVQLAIDFADRIVGLQAGKVGFDQIGRASCRERVELSVGVGV